MDKLLEKYNDYLRLENCKAIYSLANDSSIEVIYKRENFPHLLGLHKLKDLQLIQFGLDKSNKSVKLNTVLSRIRNSTFTDSMVKASTFFPLIQERYDSFSYDILTTLSYTDAIINFNPLLIKSKLKSKYILFEEKNINEYNHLGIAFDSQTGQHYIETFFHQSTNMYLVNQTTVKIKNFSLYDANNSIIITDSF